MGYKERVREDGAKEEKLSEERDDINIVDKERSERGECQRGEMK